MGICQFLLLKLRFDIYIVLNEKQFYIVWLVHVLWWVQPAVFDGCGHCSNWPMGNRERHAAAKQLQISFTCRDVVKKEVVIQTVKVIPPSNLRPRWPTMNVGGGEDSPEWKWGCWIPPKKDAFYSVWGFFFKMI